ncbi:MAG: TIGR04211 family SH3 domain-containing protein [Burkholderiaceae bacterium]|nr:TIGR04211 family SH3 domain-containing protein [Burkholderiaceae bacterium]
MQYHAPRAASRIRLFHWLIAALLFGAGAAAHAQQVRYVTDLLKLESRTGPGVEHRIVKLLESGTRLTVHEEKNGWSRISAPGVDEAWILTRYLQEESSARARLEAAITRMEAAQKSAGELREELKTLRATHKSLEQSRDKTDSRAKSLDAELSALKRTAASAVQIRDENERLTKETEKLGSELNALQRDYKNVRESRERDWFIAGAGVLLGGIVLGLLIPALVGRKRRRWGEF